MLLKNKSNFSDFFKRLKFYIFGFLIGLVLVSVFFKDRAGCKMPGTLKLEELTSQHLIYSSDVLCALTCAKSDTVALLGYMKHGKVDYSKSMVHDKPFPGYVISSYLSDGKELEVFVRDQDTISNVVGIVVSNMEDCDCKGMEVWN